MKKLKKGIEQDLEKFIAGFELKPGYQNVGKINKLNDGIAQISGLSEAVMGEILDFPNEINGVVLNLMKEEVGAIILGDYTKLNEGEGVVKSGKILSVKADYSLLGRVVNSQSEAVDGKGFVKWSKKAKTMPLEKIAPGILYRESVNKPLQTGIKAIDTLIPIGRGQRELIIGDRNTGKTAIAIDTIINQAIENKKKGNKKVISIYTAIGQKQSKVAQIIEKLESSQAIQDTIVVVGSASDPVAMQYLAPYTACAIAEYFMEKGEDVLVVYDDLTKHAWAYRQISLILRRPSGREAYPGDIFYLHSRLLERSCKLAKKFGGGSITALPIIETQAQDISAYIPTNVISITDGQIYLEPDLFYQGVRPAINIGLSVSRVGGAAQLKAVKKVSGNLRLDLAQFNELSAFAQFGSDLDETSKKRIDRGRRIIEILKQPQYEPVAIDRQLLEIWFATNGYLDNFEIYQCRDVIDEFVDLVHAKIKLFAREVTSKDGLSEKTQKQMIKIADKISERNENGTN